MDSKFVCIDDFLYLKAEEGQGILKTVEEKEEV